MKEDLEKPVSKLTNILFCLLFVLPLSAQTENLVSSQDTAFVPAALPVIEYTMQRKVYEIAEITVSGADSYEDFVLIWFQVGKSHPQYHLLD